MRRLLGNRLTALLAVAGAVAIAAGAWVVVRSSSVVAVKDVTVTGAQGPRAQEIRDALTTAARTMTTLRVDDAALREAVAGYSEVKSLTADADLPRRLRITIVTRTAVAALDTGSRRMAVAADGTVLEQIPTAGLATVKIVASPAGGRVRAKGPRQLVAVLAAAPPSLRDRADRIFLGRYGVTVVFDTGPRLRMGSATRLAAKWEAARRVFMDADVGRATYVDVRLPERPAAGGLEPTEPEVPIGAPTGVTVPSDTPVPTP